MDTITRALQAAQAPKTIADRLGIERNRIRVAPLGIQDSAVLFACLAVLERPELDAGRRHNDAVTAMRSLVPGDAVACLGLGGEFGSAASAARRVAACLGLEGEFVAAAFPHLAPIVVDYLFDSGHSLWVLTMLAMLDALAVDMHQIERARRRRDILGISELYYERPSTREGRWLRDFLRRFVRAESWRTLDLAAMWETAQVWVEAHHVAGSLTAALERRLGADLDTGTVLDWSKRLRVIDDALGRERRPGPWEPSAPSQCVPKVPHN